MSGCDIAFLVAGWGIGTIVGSITIPWLFYRLGVYD